MTTLNHNLSREVPTTIRDGCRVRPIIVELVAGDPSLYLRQKGTRQHYALPYEVAYHLAVKLEVERRRREKKARKASEIPGFKYLIGPSKSRRGGRS